MMMVLGLMIIVLVTITTNYCTKHNILEARLIMTACLFNSKKCDTVDTIRDTFTYIRNIMIERSDTQWSSTHTYKYVIGYYIIHHIENQFHGTKCFV